MRSEDIIKEHMTEDGLDFEGAFKTFDSITAESEVGVIDYLQVLEQHQAYGLMFMGELVLDMLEASDALPKGKDEELLNLQRILRLDKARRIHDMLNPQLLVEAETS